MKDILSLIANVATAFGVIFTACQLYRNHRQSITAFEDSFTREYRELASKIPTKALLGETLTEAEYVKAFDEFYHYFDLCNEQAFHHEKKRVSNATWKFWRDGINSNLRRSAFKRAWSEIAARSSSDFSELRQLFPPDPSLVIPNDGTA